MRAALRHAARRAGARAHVSWRGRSDAGRGDRRALRMRRRACWGRIHGASARPGPGRPPPGKPL